MKHTKPTPGPWAVTKRNLDNHVYDQEDTGRSAKYTIDTITGETIAGLGAGINNAALLAAAPELLECLQNLLSFDDGTNQPVDNLAWNSVRALIAKATGGE